MAIGAIATPKIEKPTHALFFAGAAHGQKKGMTNVLIDTSPDMRNQLIDTNVTWLDAILYSHDHADQTHGIDDVRAMVYAKQKRIEVWMDEATSQTLTSRFGYCFEAKRRHTLSGHFER